MVIISQRIDTPQPDRLGYSRCCVSTHPDDSPGNCIDTRSRWYSGTNRCEKPQVSNLFFLSAFLFLILIGGEVIGAINRLASVSGLSLWLVKPFCWVWIFILFFMILPPHHSSSSVMFSAQVRLQMLSKQIRLLRRDARWLWKGYGQI